MELKEARYILAIAKHQSIGKAAESLVAAQNFCQNFSKLLTKLFGKYFRYL